MNENKPLTPTGQGRDTHARRFLEDLAAFEQDRSLPDPRKHPPPVLCTPSDQPLPPPWEPHPSTAFMDGDRLPIRLQYTQNALKKRLKD